ncbi:DUF4184 family protein [Nocardia sp. NPDC052566]|uniref:DUF4184 family protein n=1 Tax=Nocardia sp. NPDC052566 TaxID=3364330 RepID=UPI0037CB670B
MPFTPAHPAAVLLVRRYLNLPALVAGSVAPDVPYYLPVPGGPETHSVSGLLGWDLLFSAALLMVFRLLAGPMVALVPVGWRNRMPLPSWGFRSPTVASAPADGRRGMPVPSGGFRSVRVVVMLAVSVVAGAATHLAWDSCTQTDGAAVRAWEWLRVSVVEPHKLYNVLGYLSSIGGLVALGAAIALWYRRTPPVVDTAPGLPRSLRWAILGSLAVAGALGIAIALTDPVAGVSGYDFVRRALIGAIRGSAVGLAFYGLLWHIAELR